MMLQDQWAEGSLRCREDLPKPMERQGWGFLLLEKGGKLLKSFCKRGKTGLCQRGTKSDQNYLILCFKEVYSIMLGIPEYRGGAECQWSQWYPSVRIHLLGEKAVVSLVLPCRSVERQLEKCRKTKEGLQGWSSSDAAGLYPMWPPPCRSGAGAEPTCTDQTPDDALWEKPDMFDVTALLRTGLWASAASCWGVLVSVWWVPGRRRIPVRDGGGWKSAAECSRPLTQLLGAGWKGAGGWWRYFSHPLPAIHVELPPFPPSAHLWPCCSKQRGWSDILFIPS